MRIAERMRRALRSQGYREKVLELATEFLLETSVLSAVFGILDSVIARGRPPNGKVLTWSLGIAFLAFGLACILQMFMSWDGDSHLAAVVE